MNKNLKKEMPTINDQDLTAVSGGAGCWWEEYGYKSPYSIGQRILCKYYCDYYCNGKLEDGGAGYLEGVGTIRGIDYHDKAAMFIYYVDLDTPSPAGEIRVSTLQDGVLGLA